LAYKMGIIIPLHFIYHTDIDMSWLDTSRAIRITTRPKGARVSILE